MNMDMLMLLSAIRFGESTPIPRCGEVIREAKMRGLVELNAELMLQLTPSGLKLLKGMQQ